MNLTRRCRELVADVGLGDAGDVADVAALTGGVSSDIAKFTLGGRAYCAKFARAKLAVAADWHAPVERGLAEYRWLQAAAKVAPQNALGLHGYSARLGGFAMDCVAGRGVVLWKDELLAGRVNPSVATAVGDLFARLHAASTRANFDRAGFDNAAAFHALRIEPYLLFPAGRHPAVAPQLRRLASALAASARVVIHGDVSPKNILLRAGAPLPLDAEVATLGDAVFDVAFCLNHLLLKMIHRPASARDLRAAVAAFWAAYRARVDWESPVAIESRVTVLLPALLLARVDGKSPVEYLDAPAQAKTRALALALLASPPPTLDALADTVAARAGDKP